MHRVVPDRELMRAAHERRPSGSARRAPLSVAAAKRAVLDGGSPSLPDGLAEERRWFMATVSQPAARRAMRAYCERLRQAGPPFCRPRGAGDLAERDRGRPGQRRLSR